MGTAQPVAQQDESASRHFQAGGENITAILGFSDGTDQRIGEGSE